MLNLMINPDFNYYFYLSKSKSTKPEWIPLFPFVRIATMPTTPLGVAVGTKHGVFFALLVRKFYFLLVVATLALINLAAYGLGWKTT